MTEALIGRIEYILDPSASAVERMHRRAHLTNHDLRTILTFLRTRPTPPADSLLRCDIWNTLGHDAALGKALSRYGMVRFNEVVDEIVARHRAPPADERRCHSTKSEDGGSTSPRVSCDGVIDANGVMAGGCGEPCDFVMSTISPADERQHCETCGKTVPEVLCPTCAKWWADNPPPADERLREALEQIAGGVFPDASTLAISGQWQEAFNRLQSIASAALRNTTPEIDDG